MHLRPAAQYALPSWVRVVGNHRYYKILRAENVSFKRKGAFFLYLNYTFTACKLHMNTLMWHNFFLKQFRYLK